MFAGEVGPGYVGTIGGGRKEFVVKSGFFGEYVGVAQGGRDGEVVVKEPRGEDKGEMAWII